MENWPGFNGGDDCADSHVLLDENGPVVGQVPQRRLVVAIHHIQLDVDFGPQRRIASIGRHHSQPEFVPLFGHAFWVGWIFSHFSFVLSIFLKLFRLGRLGRGGGSGPEWGLVCQSSNPGTGQRWTFQIHHFSFSLTLKNLSQLQSRNNNEIPFSGNERNRKRNETFPPFHFGTHRHTHTRGDDRFDGKC